MTSHDKFDKYPNGDPFGIDILKEIENGNTVKWNSEQVWVEKGTDKKKPSDIQIGGLHYKDMPIQPTYFTYVNRLDGLQHSVIKYICRYKSKGGLEDLKKARHYIDLLIEYEYGKEHV